MFPSISVEDRNDGDIRLVVQDRLEEVEPDSMRQQLEKEILLKAKGVFLWAVLVCDMVIEENDNGTKAEILQEKLVTIPGALDELYTTILCSVPETERHQTVKLFQWVLFTARPLLAEELRDALSIDKDMQRNAKIRKHASWCDTLPRFEKHVQRLSGGLVKFRTRSMGLVEFQTCDCWEQYGREGDDHDRKAQFIHQSVADYLLEKFLSRVEYDQHGWKAPIADGHFQISRSWLRYLTLDEVQEEAWRRPDKLRARFQLVPYAMRFLSYHIQKAEEQGIAQSDLVAVVHVDGRSNVQRTCNAWRVWGYSGLFPLNWPFIKATPLHILVGLGSKTAFDESLQKHNMQVDGRDAEANTPLLLAIREGQQDMALALLNRSIERRLRQHEGTEQSVNDTRAREQESSYLVDVNAENNDGETPLTVALTQNTGEVIYKLLEAGALPDVEAMILASQRGQTAIVNLLLLCGASPTSRNRYGEFPLLAAVESGNMETVETLLRKEPASVEMEANDGRGALDTAIYMAIEIAMLLIKEGSFRPSSAALAKALFVAIEKNAADLVQIILQKDKSLLEVKSRSGQTPLACAAMFGRGAVIKLLLQAGANPESRDGRGKTPLSWAAEEVLSAADELLLASGATPENGPNAKPPSLAVLEGHEAVAKLLLQARANAESKDSSHQTPLLRAVGHGNEGMVTLLLKAGANPDAKDYSGETALSLAKLFGQEGLIKLLLEAGANPESVSRSRPL